ncbi:MAG: nitrile hydratase subunit alpha [Paracoccaceae bacterium]
MEQVTNKTKSPVPIEEVIRRVWSEPEFAARLEAEPNAVLQELGHVIPDGVEIQVVRDTETVRNIHVAAGPSDNAGITDRELLQAVGGTTVICGAISLSVAATVSAGSAIGSAAITMATYG